MPLPHMRKGQPFVPSVHIDTVLPPHNIEAEQSTLGAMLIKEPAALKALDILEADDFYRAAHQTVFTAIEHLARRGQPADFITVGEYLKSKGLLESVGGTAYLTSLFDTVPSAANIEYYAEIVQQKSLLRRLMTAGLSVVSLSMQEDEEAETLLETAEKLVFSLKRSRTAETGSPICDTIALFEDKLNHMESQSDAMLGASSGLKVYDEATNGLRPGGLTVVLASSGMGKSALMCKLAVAVARNTGPVLISSNEMTREELYLRMACEMAGVDSFTLQQNALSKDEWERYYIARDVIYELPIFIDDRSSQSPGYIRSVARRVAAKYGTVAAIFCDYIQIMQPDAPTGNQTQDLGAIANELKNIARDFAIPVIALCQMNREAEKRDNKRPTLADIRQSGEIAQAADVICGIYREEYYSMRGVQGLDSIGRSVSRLDQDDYNSAQRHGAAAMSGSGGNAYELPRLVSQRTGAFCPDI